MTCPCLTGTCLKTCSAPPDAYSPSAFQFEEYCTNSWHTACPLFSLRRLREGRRGEQPVRPRRPTVESSDSGSPR